MSNILKVVDGGSGQVQHTLGKADLKAAGEGKTKFFLKQGSQYFEARVKEAKDGSFELDGWVPTKDLPEASQKQLAEAEQRPQPPGEKKPERSAAHGQDMRDPNWRNSNEAKEYAARLGAGNLALKDPKGMPHDGIPGPESIPGDKPLSQAGIGHSEQEKAPVMQQPRPSAAASQTGTANRPTTPGPARPAPKEGEK